MLDERKLAILTEIVDSYISTAEPIGSRTLSKKPSIGLSSATIRNEMSDLEDLGYLTKTHISSGRIPSDKAYRLYVNHILDKGIEINDELVKSLRKSLIDDSKSLKEFYATANKELSQKTKYITVIVSPIANSYTIEYVKLELLTGDRLLLILVGHQGESSSIILNNYRLENNSDIRILEENIKKLVLNQDKKYLIQIKDHLGSDYPNREFYTHILNLAIEFLEKQNSYNVVLNGIGNIFNYWDDNKDLKSLVDFLEDENNLIKVSLRRELNRILDISIGYENTDEILQDASIISTQYENGIGDFGNIVLIGPTRMDYKRLANILYSFSATLSGIK